MSAPDRKNERIEQVRRRFRQGECCAQAMVSSYLSDTPGADLDLLREIAAGLCGGMGDRRGECGAVLGAAMCVAPLLRDGGHSADDQQVREVVAELRRRFFDRFGGGRCEEVLESKPIFSRRRRFCEGVTVDTALILERLLSD